MNSRTGGVAGPTMSGRLGRRLAVAAAATGIVAAALVGGTTVVATAAGLLLFDQPFHNSSPNGVGGVTLPAPAFSLPNAACLTASGGSGNPVLNSCPTSPDAPGAGKLRLTDAGGNKIGAVFGASSVSTSQALSLTFDTYQYSASGFPADGLAFVLAAVDPAAPTAPTAVGPAGGSLGYTPQGSGPGMPYGYLGLGFDVYGNYSAFQGSGCPTSPMYGSRIPGQVVVRGPGNGALGYCGINSTATTSSSPAVPIRASTRGAAAVPVEVVINPTGAQFTTVSGLIVAARTYQVAFTPVGLAARTLSGPLPVVSTGLYPASWLTSEGYPKQLAFGWFASTGSNTDFHEIDEVQVSTLVGGAVPTLSVAQTAYAKPTMAAGDPVSYTVVTGVQPGAAEAYPITVTEKMPAGVVPVAASGVGWVCQPPVGQTIACVNANLPFKGGTTLSPLTITGTAITAGTTPSVVQSDSVVTATSFDASAASGGESGLVSTGDVPLRVQGPVYSNSTIVSSGGSGVSCADTWPIPDGTSGCNGIYVDDAVVAQGTCTGRVVVAPTATKSCATGTHTAAGNDPAIAAPASYAQPTEGIALQTLPSCSASSSIVTFTPGYYDDAVGLSARTNGAGDCRNKTFWFSPGAYYFDFHNSEMPATGGGPIPYGPDLWTFNDPTSVFVGGTKRGWTTTGVTASSLPGACVSPLQSKTAVGVQFVFADDSRFFHQSGSVELCGSYSASKPPIVFSGATGTNGSATRTATLSPSALSTSTAPSGPVFTPLTAATATTNDNAGPTVTNLLKSSVATLGVDAVSGLNEAISARTVLDAATITVRHGDKGVAAGSTLAVVFQSSRSGSTPITRELTLTYGSANVAYSSQTVDLVSDLKAEIYAYGGYPFTLDLVLTTSSATQTVTAQVDSVTMNIAWRAIAVRPQSGCVTVVAGCAVLQSSTDGLLANELYLQGTVYVPAAKVEIDTRAADGPMIASGIIARSFVLRSAAYSGPEVYNGDLIQLPGLRSDATPLTVFLTAWSCPAASCVQPPSTSRGWVTRGRTMVQYDDLATGVVSGQRDVTVKSWQLSR